ncbi:exodeoxyribonuclease VIII, partial [Escherichia coli]|nr:exodeoxyribonuclease VIII [Escherichia coli]
MEFFHLIKASQKSGKKDAVIWFTAKSVARANLQLDVALEEAGIEETGRGKDYAKPIRTDFPVYDDLPEEGAVDYTWCERYELQNDDRTWLPKVTAENSDEKTAQTVDSHITTESTLPETAGITLDEHDDDSTLYPVVQMPFRKQLLSQFTADELRHHVTREEYEAIGALEMDTDNSYVQNLLLAAENCPEVKGYDTKDLWRYTDAIRKVFSQDKRHELALVLRFTRMWAATDYIDRGILAREWAAGNHISSVQRTDAGTNADGGYVTDRGEGAHHTLDTLDLEIACALLPMDFNHLEIPGSIHRRAKEIVAKKEEPWKSWSALLRNQPGVLSVNRAAIFNLVRIAPENIHRTPAAHLEFVNQTMTAEFNAATELMPLRASAVQTQVEVEEPTAQPQVANLGGGMFSINGLLSGNTNPVINIPSNEAEKPETVVETTSDVQMEATQPEKDKTVDTVPPGESADATDPQTDTLNPAEVLSAAAPELANATTQELTTEASEEKASAPEEQPSQPVPEYPAYFEPGRYEGVPNDVYHAANGISSTQVKDARVSLMYFNARHVAKTIPRAPSKVLDMGNLVHALALQPENLEAEFSVEPEIPEDAFTTTATLREFIDSHNATLPALLSTDDIKALLEEHNATLPAQLPLGASLEETAQSYMALPAEY